MMGLIDDYESNVLVMLEKIKASQIDSVVAAGMLLADCVSGGNEILSFGCGHSFAAALEVSGRVGGHVRSRVVGDFYGVYGYLDKVEGVGSEFVKHVEMRSGDCFVMISHSGVKPLLIEIASFVKSRGVRLIVVTDVGASKSRCALHSSGRRLYEFADVVLDCCGFSYDCSIKFGGVVVGPLSSIANSYLINLMVLSSIEELKSRGESVRLFESVGLEQNYSSGFSRV